jgi:phage terminase small subunit
MKERKLTRKEKFFVAEYPKDWNGTEAVIRSKYKAKNRQRASEIAYQLLQKTPVKEAINRAVEERLRKVGVHVEKVLTRMAQLAFVDIRKLYRPDGTLLPPNEWPEDVASAVAGVEVFEEYQGKGENRVLTGHTKKVRMWDPNPSLTNLGKNLRIFPTEKRDDGEEGVGRVLTTLELSAKIVYLVKLAAERKKKIEAQKALGGKSQDEKPKELLK